MRNKDKSVFDFNRALDRLVDTVNEQHDKRRLERIEERKGIEYFGIQAYAFLSLHIEKPEDFGRDYTLSMLIKEYKELKPEDF